MYNSLAYIETSSRAIYKLTYIHAAEHHHILHNTSCVYHRIRCKAQPQHCTQTTPRGRTAARFGSSFSSLKLVVCTRALRSRAVISSPSSSSSSSLLHAIFLPSQASQFTKTHTHIIYIVIVIVIYIYRVVYSTTHIFSNII